MTPYSLKHGAVVLTAPSGSGKTTIARRVIQAFPELRFSTSATTRPPRDYEKHGLHYYFISDDDFKRHIAQNEFLEYEEVYPGRYYGTLVSEITRIDRENPVLLDIDVKGAMRVKELTGPTSLTIFIKPPSMEELRKRLENRGTESVAWVSERLKRAAMEMQYADKCDQVVINDDLDQAVEETLGIVRKFFKTQNKRSGRSTVVS